ncbi:hypothetical protein KEM55_005989 [Ascosphaera atra]|nr:hypothetical protein KEM55_005989 [Ascosphaera atra]
MSDLPYSYVFVTGATGFIGAHVVDSLLRRGLRVRGAARNMEKAKAMMAARPQFADKLDFVLVKDFAQGANFENIKCLEGIDAIVHVASPFFYGTERGAEDLVYPAINGVKSILAAAASPHGSTVKRIVLTSSFASVVDMAAGHGPEFTYTAEHWNPITWEEAVDPKASSFVAYRGSKKFAEKTAWDFIEREKPNFDLVALCPPLVFGPVVHPVPKASDLNESNMDIWKVATGEYPYPASRVPGWVDVRDLAEAHAEALLSPKASMKRYLPAAPEPFSYQLAADIIRAEFEGAKDVVAKGNEGEKAVGTFKLDGKKLTEEFGITYRSFKETVVDLVKQVKEELEPQLYVVS